MAKEIDNILDSIDNLPIYKKDFDIIQEIINKGDPKLFSVILESVINGDLYWSDFEKILVHTNYNNFVLNTLESQKEMSEELFKMAALRNSIIGDSWSTPKGIALGEHTDNTESETAIYNLEYKRNRDNILYEITQINENDNELSILCKIRLYNYITNYIHGDKSDNSLNPDDIFLFINDLLIPVDSRYQVLDATDIMFMNEHNLTEDQMKKYKATAFFLRKMNYEKTVEKRGD